MKYRRLGQSDLLVSEIGLGTMTWGTQNSQAEAFRQLDMAVDRGVNFIDAGEMYPIPPGPETVGLTERIIGDWLTARGGRDKLVIAGKAVGKATKKLPFHRGGTARLDRRSITAYVDEALQRLRTDYLDLLQSHWPDRSVNVFGQRYYRHEPEEDGTPLLEMLDAMTDLVKNGKVRAIGVSNETPWGLMTLLRLAEQHRLARPAAIQNPYNLINRTLELGLSEIILRENCGLMAYSPLAFGVLTGKYVGGARPPGTRMTRYPEYTRYIGEQAQPAIDAYVELAARWGLDPAQMAIAFACAQPFVTSVIIGATSDAQLAANLAAADLPLPHALCSEIEALSLAYPDPCV
ncbi:MULTISPECIES: aldo/keto reductase [unclassified Aurantimonas]|uniref:aldo/keto reductase n=1 Tax=unclassified Aurantimonas TaxID=2638230 RepID=UPI002E17EE05|nr:MULTISPECIES: aldo/keto reductase [unclassified Aurantimonas]MEC5293484.1 aldo/keto reductase [Aurantimonas sp. C2-3-R2]MEC5414551.1 aldo/keto reductase [Aurantimonas sp. C2-4-R8]